MLYVYMKCNPFTSLDVKISWSSTDSKKSEWNITCNYILWKEYNSFIQGYKRKCVIGQPYPAIQSDEPHESVKGLLIHIPNFYINRLDEFEGIDYKREQLDIITEDGIVKAYVYVWNGRDQDVSDDGWNYEEFLKRQDIWIAGEEF